MLKRNKGLEAKIALRLEGAGSRWRPAEWLLFHAGVFLLSRRSSACCSVAATSSLGLIFMALGAIGPWFYLGFRRKPPQEEFERALPDTLQLMAGSLSAGLSLAQSVDTIVREGTEPIAGEFRRVLVETRLGVPLEDALEGVAERMQSKDFEWVVMAIRIQREVGGNLAELLDTVAATIREREYLRRQVARAVRRGPALGVWCWVACRRRSCSTCCSTNCDYVMPLFTTPARLGDAGSACVVLLTVGVFWMSKVVKVEV